jgi:hypothetical protein
MPERIADRMSQAAERARATVERARAAILLLCTALALAAPEVVQAEVTAGCESAGWNEQRISLQGDDSGVGGTGVFGDDSGIGGTGVAGDDSGSGGTGVAGDASGIGGTGIFGTITAMGSICVNAERIHFSDEVVVVLEAGTAVGSANLAVGQIVWLVAHPSPQGLETAEIWVLPAGAQVREWLDERIGATGALARLSVEGPVDGWVDPERFAVNGVVVDTDLRDVRSLIDSASQVRVSGTLTRDGILRADRIAVTARPPQRPVRPVDRPPRIERPPVNDRPVRPDTSLRPNRSDRLMDAKP